MPEPRSVSAQQRRRITGRIRFSILSHRATTLVSVLFRQDRTAVYRIAAFDRVNASGILFFYRENSPRQKRRRKFNTPTCNGRGVLKPKLKGQCQGTVEIAVRRAQGGEAA